MSWPFGDLRMFGYSVIVADPPWSFELYSEQGNAKGASAQYRCMSLDDIKQLPVGHLARGDCLLLLWTTGWAMATGQAIDVVRAWGAEPVTEIVWIKTTITGKNRMGTGYRARSMHEPILLATYGNPKHKAFPSVFTGLAREHSRKPETFYKLVLERTEGDRCDLFARQTRIGFDAWGNETTKFNQEETTNGCE